MSLQNGEIEKTIDITTSDTVDNTKLQSTRFGIGSIYPNRLWVGVSGTVVMNNKEGEVITLPAVIAGRWHRIQPNVTRIRASGTTATGIVVGTTIG